MATREAKAALCAPAEPNYTGCCRAHGKYQDRVSAMNCERCGEPFEVKGKWAKYCPGCRKIEARECWTVYYETKLRPRYQRDGWPKRA